MHVEVALLPRDATRLPERVALVIDVVRATTTLCTMFERGARSVTLANDVAIARSLARNQANTLLIGEVAGLPPHDFAYGNSPVELQQAQLAERDVVFSTTNGTRALVAVQSAAAIVAACLRNGRAAVQVALDLARERGADITIVCAGRAGGTQQGMDDIICAGYLVEQIIVQRGGVIAPWQPDADFAATVARSPAPTGSIELDDSALLARKLYRSVVSDPLEPHLHEIEPVFFEAGVGQGLQRLGHAADVTYCAAIGVSDVVPQVAQAGQTPRYALHIASARI